MCNTYIFYIYAIGFRGTFSTLFADTYKSISHNTWMFSWISVVISAKMTKPLASCGMAWFSHVFPFCQWDSAMKGAMFLAVYLRIFSL